MTSRNIKQEEQEGLQLNNSSHQSGSNDFVKKLFQMLQEDGYKTVVRWTKSGDSFVVIDTNEFTKEILPRHFKHSNFASFVRQLNKYDFHKVKISNEAKKTYEYGDDAWEFKHPDFRMNDKRSLDNIKRKATTNKKNQQVLGESSDKAYGGNMGSSDISKSYQVDIANLMNQFHGLQEAVGTIKQENSQLRRDLAILESKYKSVVDNLVAAKSFDERYYNSMNLLVSTLIQAGIKLPPLDFPNPHLTTNEPPAFKFHPHQLQQQTQTTQTQAQSQQVRQHVLPHSNHHHKGQSSILPPLEVQMQKDRPNHLRHQSHNSPLRSPTDQPSMTTSTPPLIQQLQLQNNTPHNEAQASPHISPEQQNNLYQKDAHSPAASTLNAPVNGNGSNPTSESSHVASRSGGGSVDLPQIITTNIPNPKFHVLLVEDDNVCIQLCRKFLVKYGCQVTVVTDGLNAISTVESTKYDLVLMDIVMPNLDGATATSVIRSFDTKTPIIAMTGNIEDNDLVTYLQNGMSDILAKPFTKDDLYSILTKHLLSSHELQQLSIQQAQEQQQMLEQQGNISSKTTPPHPGTDIPVATEPQPQLAAATSAPAVQAPSQNAPIAQTPLNYTSEEMSDPRLKKQRIE